MSFSCSLAARMKPPRGPRSVLCVVLVTKSRDANGRGIDIGRDQAGVVSHVDHQIGADRVRDLAKRAQSMTRE